MLRRLLTTLAFRTQQVRFIVQTQDTVLSHIVVNLLKYSLQDVALVGSALIYKDTVTP